MAKGVTQVQHGMPVAYYNKLNRVLKGGALQAEDMLEDDVKAPALPLPAAPAAGAHHAPQVRRVAFAWNLRHRL